MERQDPEIAEGQYDKQLDDLVDQRGLSYGEARRLLGRPPYEMYENTTPPPSIEQSLGSSAVTKTTRRRRGNGHGPQRGEEEGVGYEGGVPPYLRPLTLLNPDQVVRNKAGITAARRALSGRNKEN